MDIPNSDEGESEEDKWFHKNGPAYASELRTAIREHLGAPNRTAQAINLLQNRIGLALLSLSVLYRHAKHPCDHDSQAVIRGIYDAHLQALYILADEQATDERGTLYLEYGWVELHIHMETLALSPSKFAQSGRSMPEWDAARVQQVAEFERVRHKYLDGRNRLLRQWYRGNLRTLARACGAEFETEYELFQRRTSSAVHSSSLSLLGFPLGAGGPIPHHLPTNYLSPAWRMAFRVLGRFAQVRGVELSPRLQALIANVWRSLFDEQNPPPDPGDVER